METFDIDGKVVMIVVHGDADVVGAAHGLGEKGIGRLRAFDVDPFGAGIVDGWDDVVAFFGTQQPAVAGVGIQSGDADFGVGNTESLAGIMGKLDDFQNARERNGVACLAPRYVSSNVDNA